MAPQSGVNGVLPVAVLQKNAPASAPRGPKAAQPRLKLVLRRLPPGITQAELEAILGEDWKVGAGKIDYSLFKKGKVSKDAAKPSKPAILYVHATAQNHVAALSEQVRKATFHDAAKSFNDPVLIAPPVLEFSPYHRIPRGRRRNDARQGMIDQDPEFKDFLESLTNPVAKPAPADVTTDAQKETKVTTTPLIEAIREKKANKDKPQAKTAAKHGRGESKDEERQDKKILGKPGKEALTEKGKKFSKAEKAAKEAVKVLNKEASAVQSKDAASSSPSASTAAPERKRGSTALAKSMLQRDLGIGPAANRRRGTKRENPTAAQEVTPKPEETAVGKQKAKETPVVPTPPEKPSNSVASLKKDSSRPSRAERRANKTSLTDKTNNKSTAEDTKQQNKAKPTPAAPMILKKPQTSTQNQPPKGPTASRAPPSEPAAARNASVPVGPAASGRNAPQAPTTQQPSPPSNNTGRQAFLKHANASQGITEALIEEALKVFGAIEKVEIDKRKGFAYVDFVEPAGLQKAIAASPVKVAQGAVQVLERKEKVARNRPHPPPPHPHHPLPPTGPARRGGFSGRGRGRGGGRGGAPVASPAPVTPAPAAETAT